MILGLVGRKGAGKSTVAKMITEMVPRSAEIAFADPMKKFVAEMFDWPLSLLNGPSEVKEIEDYRYLRHVGTGDGPQYLTPRFALQQLGTDWGRKCYPDVWIDYTLRRAARIKLHDSAGNETLVVISDVRFRNEAGRIQAAGGQIVLIERPVEVDNEDLHASELEVAEIPIRHVIHNNSSIEALGLMVGNILWNLGMKP